MLILLFWFLFVVSLWGLVLCRYFFALLNTSNDLRQWRDVVKQTYLRCFVAIRDIRGINLDHSGNLRRFRGYDKWCSTGSAFVDILKMFLYKATFIVLSFAGAKVFTDRLKIPTRATQITQFREGRGCVKLQ